jgi:chromosome segregation ATPase
LKRSINQLEQENKQIETLAAYKSEHEKERKKMESDLADLRNRLQLESQLKEKATRAEENALKQVAEMKSQIENQSKTVTGNADIRNKEIEAKLLKMQLDYEDAMEEAKRLNTLKRVCNVLPINHNLQFSVTNKRWKS